MTDLLKYKINGSKKKKESDTVHIHDILTLLRIFSKIFNMKSKIIFKKCGMVHKLL